MQNGVDQPEFHDCGTERGRERERELTLSCHEKRLGRLDQAPPTLPRHVLPRTFRTDRNDERALRDVHEARFLQPSLQVRLEVAPRPQRDEDLTDQTPQPLDVGVVVTRLGQIHLPELHPARLGGGQLGQSHDRIFGGGEANTTERQRLMDDVEGMEPVGWPSLGNVLNREGDWSGVCDGREEGFDNVGAYIRVGRPVGLVELSEPFT